MEISSDDMDESLETETGTNLFYKKWDSVSDEITDAIQEAVGMQKSLSKLNTEMCDISQKFELELGNTDDALLQIDQEQVEILESVKPKTPKKKLSGIKSLKRASQDIDLQDDPYQKDGPPLKKFKKNNEKALTMIHKGKGNDSAITLLQEKECLLPDSCLYCSTRYAPSAAHLIACRSCGKASHWFCGDAPASIIMNKELKDRWMCLECLDCGVCGSKESIEPNQIIVCDMCDAGTHMNCVSPPLEKIPDGKWLCEQCSKCSLCSKNISNIKHPEIGYTLCQGCIVSLKQSKTCPICKVNIAGQKMIKCADCDIFLHVRCVGVDLNDKGDSKAFLCLSCQFKKSQKSFKSFSIQYKDSNLFTIAHWVGLPTHVTPSNNVSYYTAVEFQGIIYRVGDAAFFRSSEEYSAKTKDPEPFLGRIVTMWQADGQQFLECVWFYTINDMKGKHHQTTKNTKERFYSNTKEVNEIHCLCGVAEVVREKDFHNFDTKTRPPNLFFCEKFYDLQADKLLDLDDGLRESLLLNSTQFENPPKGWPNDVFFTPKLLGFRELPKETQDILTKSAKFQGDVILQKISNKNHPAYGEFGAFAKRDVQKNTILGEYTGYVQLTNDNNSQFKKHICSLYDDPNVPVDIDAGRSGNVLRFINDYRNTGLPPNVCYRSVTLGDSWHVICLTTRAVKHNAEFLVDYGNKYWKNIEQQNSAKKKR